MSGTEPVPSARELILELVELQDRIDRVRVPEPSPEAESAGVPEPPELVELVEREEAVIAELRDYRESQLRLPSSPPA
ncbi:hypothetical protein GCM10009740_19870 [Terrabacter terrae]|uniref:Histidine kinase n=1 Tax=Terrabacter terrae TaxID=318434 RepID=A0ABN2U8T3_9MICO